MSDLLKKNNGNATHVSVKIGMSGYEKIKKYCSDNNYKIGAFIERCAAVEIDSKTKKVKA